MHNVEVTASANGHSSQMGCSPHIAGFGSKAVRKFPPGLHFVFLVLDDGRAPPTHLLPVTLADNRFFAFSIHFSLQIDCGVSLKQNQKILTYSYIVRMLMSRMTDANKAWLNFDFIKKIKILFGLFSFCLSFVFSSSALL